MAAALFILPATAQVTVFQSDFQASVVEANTAVTNLNVGTAVGSWSYQDTNNINIYGDATGTNMALCPDGVAGAGGYGLTANFTNSLLLKSNVTVTLLLARGRNGTSGTGKSCFLTGYDAVGNPSFDLQVFANQNQAAGTNGALYWNNGTDYTNWFGTNYSTAGDIHYFLASPTGYRPANMSALKIQLTNNGYVVSLDSANNGSYDWVSRLLPYNGNPTAISRISITGGNSAGDWFDNLLVTGVPGGNVVKVVTNGFVAIQPETQAQLINGWGFDIKGTSGNNVTPDYAQTLFVTDKMNILRVPIYGAAHPSSGTVDGTYYADQLYAMANARAANSNVLFFASKKSEAMPFPAWVTNSSGNVIAAKYAVMLGDYLKYIQDNGFTIDVLGIDNENVAGTESSPSLYNDIINDLKTNAASRGITLPKQFIGPESYSPDPSWVNTVINNGWGGKLNIVASHYYPNSRPLTDLQNMVANGGARPAWHSEVHWDNVSFGSDVINQAEACVATLFDCTDTGLSSYVWWAYNRSGIKGGIEQGFTSSTSQTHPVTTTDSDGSKATLGKLIARAYRNGTNIVVWVLNNTTNLYSPCSFNFNSGSLVGPVNSTAWDVTGSTLGSAGLASATNFTLTIGARTVTMVTVGYNATTPNSPPVLTAITNRSLIAGQILNVTNSATDPNVPPQVLTWSLQPVIAGLTINTNTGIIQWRPTIAQSPTTNALSVIVADNGSPSLSATQQFLVTVVRPILPVLSSPALRRQQWVFPEWPAS